MSNLVSAHDGRLYNEKSVIMEKMINEHSRKSKYQFEHNDEIKTMFNKAEKSENEIYQ